MYVHPSVRGQGIGRRLLAALEEEARYAGLDTLRLETGIAQPEALALYRSAGFAEGKPFGDYHADRHSLFMEKRLG
jgi:putative acetyltransferase